MFNYRQLHYLWSVAKAGGIARGAEQLHLTPQTLSGQISQFEQRLGASLFHREGRRMELSATGKLALSYAEEIFQVSAELEARLRDAPEEIAIPFRVGIADVVPKSIAHQLLAPVLSLAEPIRLICREDRLERLLADLAIHRLDMVLADKPMPSNIEVKCFSHPLGECGVAFFAARPLARKLRAGFPGSLDGGNGLFGHGGFGDGLFPGRVGRCGGRIRGCGGCGVLRDRQPRRHQHEGQRQQHQHRQRAPPGRRRRCLALLARVAR